MASKTVAHRRKLLITRATKAKQARIADPIALAGALYGPVHSYVCQFCNGATPYHISHESKLPKRTVDSVVTSLIQSDIIQFRGLKVYYAKIPLKRVTQTFGKRAAALMVYGGIPKPRKTKRRRYRS